MKRVEFSETIAASDLKVSRCRYIIEFMKVCEYYWPKVVYSAANTYFPLYLLLGETGYRVIRFFYREIII